MEFSPPPLTLSPHSSPETFCSESPVLEYTQPDLGRGQQKITPLYDQSYATASSMMDAQNSLPPLDTTTSSPGWTTSTALQPLPALSLPNILSADYDPFAHYESNLGGTYNHDMYTSQHSHGSVVSNNSPSIVGTPCRSPDPMGRHGSSYHRMSSPIPRVKAEGMVDYARAVAVSQYPSPRSSHTVPASQNNYTCDNVASGYVTELPSTGWSRSEYIPLEPEQSSGGNASLGSGLIPDNRRQIRSQRTQKKTRKLTTKEEANFQCEVKGCGKLFSRSYNFKAHMETHADNREYPFPCTVPDCNKKFVRKTDLQRHHQSVHMKEKNHRCDFCGRMFARKDTLRRYVTLKKPLEFQNSWLKLSQAYGRWLLKTIWYRYSWPTRPRPR